MATKNGRLEAKITVPTGGWAFTMSITGLGGTSARTIAAGAYWPGELINEFVSELEDGEVALGGSSGFSAESSFGESGTGLFRITYDGGVNFAISAWGSTDLRDALGFASALSGFSAYDSTIVHAGVWISHAIMAAPRNQDDGHTENDRSVTVGPRGHVKALGYQSRRRTGRILWSHVQGRYAIESMETTVGESFERWWLDTHGGRESYFGRAPLVRLYWDADAATYVEIRLVEPIGTFNPERAVQEWAGLWVIVIDGYKVPS
jgi:hypothetical protein